MKMDRMNELLHIQSFLSSPIKKLFSQPVDEASIGRTHFLETISKWNEDIILELSPFQRIEEPRETVQWYRECVQIVHAFQHDFWQYILFLGPDSKNWPYLKWIGYESDFEKIIGFINSQNDVGDQYLSILMASSLAERILGNIFLIEGKTIPYLLRDLINSLELKHLLGNSLVDVLKVLVGSVNGYNLRNLAWHGFLSPYDIQPSFAALIISALHLCGYKISLSNQKIASRAYLCLDEIFIPFQNIWENVEIGYEDAMMLIESSVLVPLVMKTYWIKALNLLLHRRYEALILLLPLLENSLRILFASVCKCPARILTATHSTFYTTLDEILSPWLTVASSNPESSISMESKTILQNNRLQDSSLSSLSLTNLSDIDSMEETIGMLNNCNFKILNKTEQSIVNKGNLLPQLLGQQLTEALYDLFHFHSGPRIRDRISHGEVSAESVSFELTLHLFNLCLLVLSFDKWRFIEDFQEKGIFTIRCQCESLGKENICPNHYSIKIDNLVKENYCGIPFNILENSLLNSLVCKVTSYRSIFHPVTFLRNIFLNILGCLASWKNWARPKQEILLINPDWKDYETKFSNYLFNVGACLYISDSTVTTFSFKLPLELSDIVKPYTQIVLFTANSELEIIRMLQRISDNIEKSLKNIKFSLETKLRSFLTNSFRSRQRESYKKQLEIVPYIIDNIIFTFNVLIMIYLNKNRVSLVSNSQFKLLVKILKKVLKGFENLSSFTESAVNKYHESLTTLNKMTSFLVEHFAVFEEQNC